MRRLKPCPRRVEDSRWWGFLTMVPAGNKAKHFSSVNHTTKTIHHYHHRDQRTGLHAHTLHKKVKFSFKDFFSKCDQICRKLWIGSQLLKKSSMENFIFYAVTWVLYIIFSLFSSCLLFTVSKQNFLNQNTLIKSSVVNEEMPMQN